MYRPTYQSPFAPRRRTMRDVWQQGGFNPPAVPQQQPRNVYHATAQAQAPPPGADPDDPFVGKKGNGWNSNRTQRKLMQLGASNAFKADPLLWSSIFDLQSEAENNRLDDIAANYGGDFEQLDQYYNRAENSLGQNMAARGLQDSSAMASGLGSLASGRAGAQAQMATGIRREADQRQLAANAQLQNLLASLQSTGSGQGAGIANQLIQQQLAQQQMEGPGFMESLFGGIGGLAGLAGMLGWNPFGGGGMTGRAPGVRGGWGGGPKVG